MRRFAWIFFAMLAGLALGLGVAAPEISRLAYSDQRLVSAQLSDDVRSDPRVNPGAPRPVIHLEATEFEFGQMQRGSTMSHSFTIENRGDAPLVLTQGTTSCKCTLSGLDDDQIAPGSSGTVSLTWSATTDKIDFRQTATIHTNDPNRPSIEFVVKGKVYQEIELEPEALYINKLAGELKSYQVRATSANIEDLQFVGHSFDDPSTADFFDISYHPLPSDTSAISSEGALQSRSGALVTVTLKPGLPLGPFRQTIRLDTNSPEQPQVPYVIMGSVDGDISVVGGRQWNAQKMLLAVGVISARTVTERELKLLVRGKEAGQVEFRVQRVSPPSLEARVGVSTSLSGGRVQQTPVTITFPQGTPPMTYMGTDHGGYGEVVLATTHPDVPELTLRVQFAVEP